MTKPTESMPMPNTTLPNNVNPTSQTPQQSLLAKLKQLVPEAFSEGKLSMDKLQAVLGEDDGANALFVPKFEAYGLSWAGKRDVYKELKTATSQTLLPQPEQSVDFDGTQNLFLEGDNLQVLKILQKSYYNRIKMIYIDPPYNTGNDRFIYPDDYSESLAEYQARTGQADEDGNLTQSDAMKTNRKENGQYHSNWLNMMYPRLALAKNLLRDDGVIFVSIDDNEVANLRLLMDEIFGEENFVAHLIVKRSANGMGSKLGFSNNHDYILCYVRNVRTEESLFRGLKPDEDYISKFNKVDEYGRYKIDGILNKKGQGNKREDSPGCFYPVYYDEHSGQVSLEKKDGFLEKYPKLPNGEDGRWVWSKKFAKERVHRLYASKSGTIYVKDYYDTDLRVKPKTILEENSYLTNQATNELKNLFGEKTFDTPKPQNLIYDLIDIGSYSNDIILDFFAGSSTTAHAVMALNAEDGGNRKFIMVQIPEDTDPDSEAHKAGFTNIAEISKERIRRAGKQIRDEHPDTSADLGFKVYRLADSNFIPWRQPETMDADSLLAQLEKHVNPIADTATDAGMVTELMLKEGYSLTASIRQREGYYLVTQDKQWADEGVQATATDTSATADDNEALMRLVIVLTDMSMAKAQHIIALAPSKTIILDSAFSSDANKANILLQFEDAGLVVGCF